MKTILNIILLAQVRELFIVYLGFHYVIHFYVNAKI